MVTHGRTHLFGEVINGEVRLSVAGEVASACWHAIPEHFPQAELGAFVVMPNHVHGIIMLHERATIASSHVGAQHVVPLRF